MYFQQGPHPGMRAAAADQSKQTKGSGGRGGMMGVVLPMYAVGIVLYLAYTLFKVNKHTWFVFNVSIKWRFQKWSPRTGTLKQYLHVICISMCICNHEL